MEIAIIGIGILCAASAAFYGYNFGFQKGLSVGKNEALKSINDYTQGKESELAKNISQSYQK